MRTNDDRPESPPGVPRLVGKSGFDHRFDVVSQVLAAGTQDVFVHDITPLSGPGRGQLGIRVGRLLVWVAQASFGILRGRLATGRGFG